MDFEAEIEKTQPSGWVKGVEPMDDWGKKASIAQVLHLLRCAKGL